jgi:hypothetical protein
MWRHGKQGRSNQNPEEGEDKKTGKNINSIQIIRKWGHLK